MWDFSWIERRSRAGGYANWDRVLDELVERGYDAVRIDPYPHLYMASEPAILKPVWSQHDWGSPLEATVSVRAALIEFVGKCRERGVAVGLSSWFREDLLARRMELASPVAMAVAWAAVLGDLEAHDLLESVLYVDLCNEFPLRMWAPFMFDADSPQKTTKRTLDPARSYMEQSIAILRAQWPSVPFCYSFTDDLRAGARSEDVGFMDLLELHLWLTSPETSNFYGTLGYDIEASNWDPAGYAILRDAPSLFASDRGRWLTALGDIIDVAASWSRRARRPLITTECWAAINYKDAPGLDWGWIREVAEVGVRAALDTRRWVALATSNFCGPQFVGMWRDISWHQRLTGEIRGGIVDPDLAL